MKQNVEEHSHFEYSNFQTIKGIIIFEIGQ